MKNISFQEELFSRRLSQNTFAGRGCPPPGPSPTWRYPMESRFTIFAQDLVQVVETLDASAPIRVYRRFIDLFGTTSRIRDHFEGDVSPFYAPDRNISLVRRAGGTIAGSTTPGAGLRRQTMRQGLQGRPLAIGKNRLNANTRETTVSTIKRSLRQDTSS